jgi:hypothetical protein
VNTCWGESTPPAQVSSVASEPIVAEATGKGDGNIGNIGGTRVK